MKKLLMALSVAATAAFASATSVTTNEGFEGSSYTAYDENVVAPSANDAVYPFTGYGARYCDLEDLDDGKTIATAGGSYVDATVQFKLAASAGTLDNEAKLGIYANSSGNIVVVDANGENVTETPVSEGTWYHLTIVPVDGENNFTVYLNFTEVGTYASRLANNTVQSVTFQGSGKLDNFVARSENFMDAMSEGYAAYIGGGNSLIDSEVFTTVGDAIEASIDLDLEMKIPGGATCDGTSAHPYLIPDAATLVKLQQLVAAGKGADKCYLQTANIDMTGEDAFAGIGVYNVDPTEGTPFTGTYDGGNFKISNVTMTGRNYGGIFNQVNGGTIKNLTVENINVADGASDEYGYAIVGHAANGATLQNLTAMGSFLSAGNPGTHNMAGIVVRACGGATAETVTTIANCTNNAAIYGAYTKLAGVCAIVQTQTNFKAGSVLFQNCANTGALTSSYASDKATGLAGILAYSAANTVLDGCTNTGTLSNTSETANTDVNGSLVGTVQNNTLTLKSAIASGDIGKFNAGCTVALDFDVSGSNVDFNLYGATGSTVELLQDFTGYPAQNAVINPTLKLSANMTINDGWQNETNATFTAISGTGTLTASHKYNYVKFYRIKKLDGFTGTLASGQPQVYFVIDDIVAAETPAYGAAVVKGGSSLKVYDLASTTLGGVAADLCVDTLDNQNGIYLVAAQVVADDQSTTGYASVENALAAADAAYASTVNVLDSGAEEVAAAGWSYENGVYTSTRAIATLKGTSYPSLAKALAAAQDGDTVTLVAATSEAVTIPAGVTVAVTDDVAFNGTVAGAGAVKYTAAQTGTIKFGEWTGTVTLDWAGIVNANDIAPVVSKYGKEGSTVEIGPNGTITGDSYFNSDPVVTLKVSGFVSINNGSTNNERTLPTVTGDGVLVFGSSGGRVNYRITNLVEWDGVVTNSSAAVGIANVTSGSGKIVFASTPDIAPAIGEGFTGEVYLNFNYSNYNIALYGGVNATRYLGAMSGHLHDGAGETGQTGEIPGKTVVSGAVDINNGWTIGSANWTAAKVVKFDSLKVDGSLTLDSTSDKFGTARCYYYVRSLDAAGAGTITVGDGFGLRIDAVDFAEAPSGSGVLVSLTLAKANLLTTDGQLFGTGGTLDGSIAVTVNGEATEQTLVYDADKGGLVLYVAPAPVAIAWTLDANGDTITTYYDTSSTITDAIMAFSHGEGVAIRFAEALSQDLHKALVGGDCTYDAETLTYTKFTPVASMTIDGITHEYPTLAAAFADAQDGNTVKLLANVAVTEMQLVTKSVALDLNGFAITAGEMSAEAVAAGDDAILCVLHGGSLTINDSSAGGTGAITGNSVFTSAVKMTKKGDTDDTKKAVLVVNGGTLTGYYYGISGNGLAGRGNTEVTINGGSVYGTCVNDSVAIFQPQLGKLTINGGYLEGAMGVYVKSGTATVAINGGTIKGNGTYAAYVHSTNGFNNTGDAFVVDNAGYPGGAPAPSILGGTFVSVNASAIASYAKTGLERIVHFADKDAVTITEAKASSEDVFLEKGFPGGADGKTFNIDTAVQAALEAKLPAGKALTDTVEGTTSGVTYAQAYALGLLDEKTGDVEKDVTPTIEVKNGKVVVSLDATAKAGYKVMLNVYQKTRLTDNWPVEPTTRYELGSADEATGFTLSATGAGFYKVGVTIEDKE